MSMFMDIKMWGSIRMASKSGAMDMVFHGSIEKRGLASASELSRTVRTKSSYPDMGVCEMKPLTGVGSGDRPCGSADGIPFGGDCSKNGGVVVAGKLRLGFSSGVGFWSCMGCEIDG